MIRRAIFAAPETTQEERVSKSHRRGVGLSGADITCMGHSKGESGEGEKPSGNVPTGEQTR